MQTEPAHLVTDRKDELRRELRERRRRRTGEGSAEPATRIADALDTVPGLAGAGCVAAYVARRHEPDTAVWLERLRGRGVRVLLPVLGEGLRRDWAEYRGQDDLAPRAPGRPSEPGGPALGEAALAEADLVVVPALAVDVTGARLGQGGGWYDRALAHVRPGVPVVALLHEGEVWEAAAGLLPTEPHDRPVDLVVTPTGCRDLRPEQDGPVGR